MGKLTMAAMALCFALGAAKTAFWKGERRCQVKNTEPCNKIMEKVWRVCTLDDPFNACMKSKFIARYRFNLCKPVCTTSSIGRCTLVGGC